MNECYKETSPGSSNPPDKWLGQVGYCTLQAASSLILFHVYYCKVLLLTSSFMLRSSQYLSVRRCCCALVRVNKPPSSLGGLSPNARETCLVRYQTYLSYANIYIISIYCRRSSRALQTALCKPIMLNTGTDRAEKPSYSSGTSAASSTVRPPPATLQLGPYSVCGPSARRHLRLLSAAIVAAIVVACIVAADQVRR